MSSVDKFGIIFVIAITVVAVSFAVTGGLNSIIMPIQTENTSTTSEFEKEVLIAKKASEDIEKLSQNAQQTTEKIKELTKDAISSKLPAKFVSIPQGTSTPGCEEVNRCYDPPNVTIFVGGEIIWRNDDLSAHTVTSGTVIGGPDGNFNSGLILPGQTFSNRFDDSGEFRYFCMIHPWATGLVTVS